MFQLTWQDATEWSSHGRELRIPGSPTDPAVSHAGLLFWEEHCVECAIPQCYSTCSLYVSRPDRKCARFVYGIAANPQVRGLFDFGADIRFRRWAKLEATWPTTLAMPTVNGLRRQSAWLNRCERLVSAVAVGLQRVSPTRRLNGAFTWLRRQLLAHQSAWQPLRIRQQHRPRTPDVFFLKCYSPESTSIRIQLELVTDVPVFRTSLEIQPGWNEHFLDAEPLILQANSQPGRLRISIDNDREVRLIFTWLDFVCLEQSAVTAEESKAESTAALPADSMPAEKVKCVAWDLDNTLWQGVIGDAGPDGVVPDNTMVEMIQQLDERGILQTIVSKNNYETAWPKIEELGLADYFLFPAIHWGPKSRSVQQVADELNINVDTFAVIDDSAFERHEIRQALPQVRVFDPAAGSEILDLPEFQVSINAESRQRRLKYLAEAQRRRIRQTWRGDYDQFLRSCHMVIRIRHPSADDCMRCLELLQRSNQFNLSGRRYSEQEFDDLLRSTWHDCYCFEVSDDFGSYGIVGFAAFLLSEAAPLLVDFVLSCRVAQKLVEATFFSWYAERQQRHGQTTLRAELLPTPRNAPLQEVLRQFGFSSVAGRQGRQDRQLLEFSMDGPLQQPEVMIVDDSRVWDSATRLYVDDSDIPAVSNDASDRQSWWSEAGHRGAA